MSEIVKIHPYDLFEMLEKMPLEKVVLMHDDPHGRLLVDGVLYEQDTSLPFKNDLRKRG